MWREIASFNGSVFALDVETNGWLSLHLCCFEYELFGNNFIATAQKSVTLKPFPWDPRSESLSCLGFKILLDHECGIFLPFFVTQVSDNLNKKPSYCYLVCLDPEKYEWIVKYSFQVPKVVGQSVHLTRVMDYSITNGPTIVWIAGDEILIYKAQCGFPTTANVLLRLSVPKNDIEMDLQRTGKMLWWCNGLYPCNSEQGLIIFKKDQLSEVSTYLVTLDQKHRAASIHLTTCVIPPPYLSITTCSSSFPQSSVPIKSYMTESPHRVFICTSQSQLVEFFEGQYVKHVNIPLSYCQTVEVFEGHTGQLIVLCAQQDRACAVDWKTGNILRTWLNIHKFLIDDFLGRGTDQVLLFPGNFEEQQKLFEVFILSDLLTDDVIRAKRQEQDNQVPIREPVTTRSEPSEENCVENVIRAVFRKLKDTEASVIECEMEKSEKLSFVKKQCDMLHNILMNTKPETSFQSLSLANLLVGSQTYSDEGSQRTCSKLAVLSKWQDLCDCDWIVGLEIENVGESTVSDISLCLVNKNAGILPSYSKACMAPEYTERPQSNVEKEPRLVNNTSKLVPGQKITMTTTSRIPVYGRDRLCTCGLMLSWKQVEENHNFAQFCGEMTLSVDDVLNTERRTLSNRLRVCRHLALSFLETQVILSVRDTNIRRAIELLKSKTDVCQYCSDDSSSGAKYRLRANRLGEVHVSFESVQNGVIVNIFTRDNSQLFTTLYMLKKYLPDDVTCQPFRNQELYGNIMKCMEEEVISSIRKLTNLFKLKVEENLGASDVELASETLEKIKEISVKRRKLSQLRDSVQRHYDGNVNLGDCLREFSDICYNLLTTRQTFIRKLIFMLLCSSAK